MKKLTAILLFIFSILVEAENLKIVTYNIYGGRLADGKKIGQSLKKIEPDFVSLQEVDSYTKRSNYRSMVKDIAEELDYPYYYFEKTRNYDSGEFGIAFISKYPIEKIYVYDLPSNGVEKRKAIGALIEDKFSGKKILIADTHLDFSLDIKSEEITSLLNALNYFQADIKFLAGDLNILPDTDYYKHITESMKDTNMTYDPRIDYIFGDKSNNWQLVDSKFLKYEETDWTKMSDHLPYMSEIEIK